ncbi:unnamed protein product [Alternaria burnsii]|nr:unnamed protein product [Alternaria burnsii]
MSHELSERSALMWHGYEVHPSSRHSDNPSNGRLERLFIDACQRNFDNRSARLQYRALETPKADLEHSHTKSCARLLALDTITASHTIPKHEH